MNGKMTPVYPVKLKRVSGEEYVAVGIVGEHIVTYDINGHQQLIHWHSMSAYKTKGYVFKDQPIRGKY